LRPSEIIGSIAVYLRKGAKMETQAPTVILLPHVKVEFEDCAIYATGNAYQQCDFSRCTIIVRDGPFLFAECKFFGCIWHIDTVIHDNQQLDRLNFVLELARQSIPMPSSTNDPMGPIPEHGGNAVDQT